MAADPRFVDMSAIMRDATKELDRVCVEIGEEDALYTAGGILAAAIAFFTYQRSPLHALAVLDGQIHFLEEAEAQRREAATMTGRRH